MKELQGAIRKLKRTKAFKSGGYAEPIARCEAVLRELRPLLSRLEESLDSRDFQAVSAVSGEIDRLAADIRSEAETIFAAIGGKRPDRED
jgi:hypothetical protein